MVDRVEYGPALVGERLHDMGIKVVALDADDTLFNTSAMFDYRIDRVASKIGKVTGEQKGDIDEEYRDIIRSLGGEFNVKPARIFIALDTLLQLRGINNSNLRDKVMTEMDSVYWVDVPEVYPGVPEMLDDFGTAEIMRVVLTHAENKWTERKMTVTGLSDKLDNVFCLDVGQLKDSLAWGEKYNQLGLYSWEVLVVGDNPYSDMLPNLRLGATCVHVGNGIRDVSSTPEGAIYLENTGNLVEWILA